MTMMIWRPEAHDHIWENRGPPREARTVEALLTLIENTFCVKCGSKWNVRPAKVLGVSERPEMDCPEATDPELLSKMQAAYDET